MFNEGISVVVELTTAFFNIIIFYLEISAKQQQLKHRFICTSTSSSKCFPKVIKVLKVCF